MKKITLWLCLAAFIWTTSGCTHTIEGIQEDSSNAWHGTKHMIHDATED
jgi:predicted small secreted protein